MFDRHAIGQSRLLSTGRDISEGVDWTTTSYCNVCLLLITAPSSRFQLHLIRLENSPLPKASR